VASATKGGNDEKGHMGHGVCIGATRSSRETEDGSEKRPEGKWGQEKFFRQGYHKTEAREALAHQKNWGKKLKSANRGRILHGKANGKKKGTPHMVLKERSGTPRELHEDRDPRPGKRPGE